MNNEQLIKIAYLHYIDDLPQNEIAKMMGISKSSVSRALQTARDRGIVTIEINMNNEKCYYLQKKIKAMYNIETAIVVPNYTHKRSNVLVELGKAGAEYLKQIVKDGMTISISMGRTLSEVANYLEVDKEVTHNIVPISGGLGQVSPELHSNDICRRIAEKFNGIAYPLYAPAVVSTKSLKEGIMDDPMIQKVVNMAKSADYTLVSVGNIADSTYLDLGIISQHESKEMQEIGAIGDIGGNFFNGKGEVLDLDIHDRIIGPDFKELRKHSKIIMVAGDRTKEKVIQSALLGNLADVLITDEQVASNLIK